MPLEAPDTLHDARAATTSFLPIAAVTFLASLGTGVLWNGIGFVAKSAYGYRPVDAFLLMFAFGVAYVAMAVASGRITRALERWLSPRGVLAVVFLVQAGVAPLVLIPRAPWAMWTVGCIASGLSAVQWPVIESYVAGGRARQEMRTRIGCWNVTWMSAVWLGVAGLGPLLEGERALTAVLLLAPLNVGCLLFLAGFRRSPGAHVDEPLDPVPATYAPLLASVRVLLPLGYVVASAMSAALPYLVASVGAPKSWETTLASTWLATRVVTVLALWNTRGWHGRWGSLLGAGVLCPAGFAIALLAPNALVVAMGLALFGIGQGAIYYMAIYYALAVGRAAVDAAGTHEALIGVGYAVGPLTGITAYGLAATESRGDAAFVAAVLALVAIGSIPAVTPYLRARRRARALPPQA